MPEECNTVNDLERVLDELQDYTLNGHQYQTLQNALDSIDHITAPLAEKLLSLCVVDRIEDLKYTAHVINIIFSLLKKIKNGHYTTLPNLVPSALAVLNVLKTTALFSKVEALKILCFEIIAYFPEDTLINITENHANEIFEFINVYCHQLIPPETRVQPIIIVGKLLKILPPDKKTVFVKNGIKVWFSKVISIGVDYASVTTNTMENILEALEILTEELVQFDYSNNHDWRIVLENIHTPSRYPAIMKTLLVKNSDHWHRLWIIFIKLLKSQITKCTNTTASPINSLLPCVEIAFKMDIKNRCRAFQCWTVLIDNFSKETNEAFLNKRLKLLVVPLTSNNAKVEETALAKFTAWWHLITRFQFKMDKFIEMVIVPFLHFCFGKPTASTLIPGKISETTKIQCVQAFLNIVGHAQCDGCVSLPRLNVKLLNTKLLVNHRKDWVHSLSNAIRICAEHCGEFSEKQINCVWKSFIMTIAELPENNIRQDLFIESLSALEGLTQDCDNRLMGAIVNTLIPTLFDKDDKIQALLKSKDEQNSPIYKILSILNKLPLDNMEDGKNAVKSLRPLTNFIVEDNLKTSSDIIERLLNQLSSNGLPLWTALAESIYTYILSVRPDVPTEMFTWPFKFMNHFVNREESTSAWLKMYKIVSPYVAMKLINEDIVKALLFHSNSHSSYVFALNALIVVSEQKLKQEESDWNKVVDFILQLTSKINEDQLLLLLPSLAVVIVGILDSLVKTPNITIAEHTMFIINNILKIYNLLLKQQLDNGTDLVKYIDNIFNSLESTFRLEMYSKLKLFLVDQLKECAPYLKQEKSLNKHILAIYNTSSNNHVVDHMTEEVIQAFEIVDTENPSNHSKTDLEQFNTPSRKATKKSKKEASIVNTVVENGEEYVVVKSNWKFNPKKLTDNQKEKMQRKREDIPALYQDLSQSQDEFKLSNWKTDSQDISTTSSKSTYAVSNEDVSVIIRNISNSEFMPKIVENVIKPTLDLNKIHAEEKINVNSDRSENCDKVKAVQNIVKSTKTPRMALKDRVFRNVRNLMSHDLNREKVGCTNDGNVLNTSLITKINPSANQTTQINTERPSRVKRKPKKFDDVELFSLKKRRTSNLNGLQTDIEMIESETNSKSLKGNKIDTEEIKENGVNEEKLMNISNENSLAIKDTSWENIHVSNIAVNTGNKTASDEQIIMTNSIITESVENAQNNFVQNEELIEKDKEKSSLDNAKNLVVILNRKTVDLDILDDGKLLNLGSKIKDKIGENVYTEDTSNETVKVDKIKETGNKICLNTKNIADSTPKSKKEEQVYEEKCHDLTENNAINKTIETTGEKLCSSHTKNNSVSTDDTLKETVEENDSDRIKTSSVVITQDDKEIVQKSSSEIITKRISRMEHLLAIDMVEGHPFLKSPTEKRLTRKAMVNTPSGRKSLAVEENKSKFKRKTTTKEAKTKICEKSVSIKDSQNTEDISGTQDVIESSQDSTVTPISAKSTKTYEKKVPVVKLKPILCTPRQDLLDDVQPNIDLTNIDSNNELPCNNTIMINLTEDMDTEPINDHSNIVVDLCDESEIIVSSENMTVELNTQNEADADTQPVESNMFLETNISDKALNEGQIPEILNTAVNWKNHESVEKIVDNNETNSSLIATAEDITKTMSEENASSPCCNDQREKDFLNNTAEISPIKTLSPLRNEKSVSPETSSDYIVIKLASPVQTNGEPFEKSPEVFTEDRVSPDKRDRSPPRDVICVVNTSPSSSLSLKKNRPQVRPGGRAAQMLGLCVPDRLQTTMNAEKPADVEEAKKSPSLNTPARRNLRILYASGESNNNSDEAEDSENFLKFKRTLPTTDCSPSGPILKRKFIDTAEEATASPASKRKRVSFHDPPVSTTICVKKYIEPACIRSPQNSSTKKLERQARAHAAIKSPRRLENVFKLDSVLTKTVESFSEAADATTNDDTEMSSLDDTPVVEVIKTSDLNNTDPICVELVDCDDEIANIAAELSSPAMRTLLLETVEGKLETIGDLAKMTELEVNRLSIKAPQVQVVKKVLSEYLTKLKKASEDKTTNETAISESIVSEVSVEVQTDSILVESIEMQTECAAIFSASSQTDLVQMSHSSAQTKETGSKSTTEIITTCLSQRPDFVERLCDNIDESFKQRIAEDLSLDTITQMLLKRLNVANFRDVLIGILDQQKKLERNYQNEDGRLVLSILQDHLTDKFDCKDLILFCSNLLKRVHDKPA